MAVIDVLKYDGPNNVLVWKWRPRTLGSRREELLSTRRDYDIRQEELRFGTQLVVNQSQQAVFVKDGRIADIFDAGRHTLSAQNLPVLTRLIGIAFGGQSPFKAEVYFINMAVAMDTKFGLMPFNMIEPNFRVPVPLTSRGSFAVRIADTSLFMSRIIGTVPDFEANTLRQFFRGIITENVKSAIYKIAKEQNLSPLELEAIVFEVSEAVKGIVSETLEKYGLYPELFNIEAISIIDEDERVKKIVEDYQRLMSQDMEERMRLKRRAENLDVYKTERTFDTTEKVAENIGGSGISGNGGGIVGTLIGLGMATPIANTMAHTVSSVTSNIQQPASEEETLKVIRLLKELGELKAAGILTDEEFTRKKNELLSKI